MKRMYHDAFYAYASARLTALENKALTDERLARVIDAPTFAEARIAVCEAYGVAADASQEEVLSEATARIYAFAEELLCGTPGDFEKPFGLLLPFRYVYDCQNLKSAIKCDALGRAAGRELFSACGSRTVEDALEAVRSRDFSAFPASLAGAAEKAVDELAASRDPACVDRLLDKAVFADMLAEAEKAGIPYLIGLIRCRIDLINVMTAYRMARTGLTGTDILPSLIPGGTVEPSYLAGNANADVKAFAASLAVTDYAALADEADAAAFEKRCDALYLEKAHEAKRAPFGVEHILCYIAEKEAEIRNVRIVLSGKSAGLAGERIRKMLR